MRLDRCWIAIALAAGACSGSLAPDGASGGDAQEPIPPGCGDGVKSPDEACDQGDLGGTTCASAAAPGWTGIVSCTITCRVNIAGCTTPSSTWKPFAYDGQNWIGYDVAQQFTNPPAEGFASSVFDGRYLYLVPNFRRPVPTPSGLVVRYDTASEFASSGSWSTFDLAVQKSGAARGYVGGAFDGRYVYFVPNYNGAYHGTVARYDTQHAAGSQDPGAAFKDPGAWETFDVATLPGAPKGFASAAFDGRYVYLTPHRNAAAVHGTIVRYDTRGAFVRESWEAFDLTTVVSTAKGFLGSVFDGRYVYLVPYQSAPNVMNSTVMRFDTRAPGGLSARESWTTYNTRVKSGAAVGFRAGVFDGRYVYLVSYYSGADHSGVVARVDTKADFTADDSWSVFNVATVNGGARGFIGATFDGKYIYLVPHYNQNAYRGLVARFDTTADFTNRDSWGVFNMPSAVPGAVGYFGAGFDGRYVYFIPHRTSATNPHGLVMRFDAKSPGWLPLQWNGGFN